MSYGKVVSGVLLLLSSSVFTGGLTRDLAGNPTPAERLQEPGSEIRFIEADDLRAKLAKDESLTVIDVRDTRSYVGSNSKIKGALHVKLRKLGSRLSFPPLRDVSRDRDVVTYCACPNDEASIRAAQILSQSGFKRVFVLKGGWRMWLKAGGQVDPRPRAI